MHKFSTASTKSSALTALHSVGLLNVPYSTLAGTSVARLVRSSLSSLRDKNLCIIRARAPCARWWTRPLIVFRNAGSFTTASPASAVRSVARSTCWPSAARLVISARRVRPSEWRPLWSGLLVRSSKRFLTGSWCGPFGPVAFPPQNRYPEQRRPQREPERTKAAPQTLDS